MFSGNEFSTDHVQPMPNGGRRIAVPTLAASATSAEPTLAASATIAEPALAASAPGALVRLIRFAVRLCAVVCLFNGMLLASAAGQDAAPAAEPAWPSRVEDITKERIEERIRLAADATELDDVSRPKVLERYQQALANLRRLEELQAAAARFQEEAESLSERHRETREKLEELRTRPRPAVDETASVSELEQDLLQQETALAALRRELERLEAEPGRRTARRREVRALLASAPERLDEVRRQLETPAPADEPAIRTAARKTDLLTRRHVIQQEMPVLQQELALYDAEDAVDLLRQRRDLATRQADRQDQFVKELKELVQRRRRAEAEALLRQARLEQFGAHPLLRPFAERNIELAEKAHTLAEWIETTDADLAHNREVLDELRKQATQTREKVESVGLTKLIGMLLRKQRQKLPRVDRHRRNIAARREVIDDAQFALLEFDDERSELANPEPIIRQVLREASPRIDEEQRGDLELAARDVLQRQRDALDSLIRNYNTYFDKLVDLHSIDQQIIAETEEFAKYIDERVLWIRSGKVLSLAELRGDRDSLELLVSPANWLNVGRLLQDDAVQHPITWASGLLLFLGLLYFGRRFREELVDIGEQAQKGTCVRFELTLRAALLTLLTVLPWPAFVLFLWWRLSSAPDADDGASAVADGLWTLTVAFFLLELSRQICRRRGLADSHFSWPSTAVRLLRQDLRLFMLVGLPLLFITSTLHTYNADHGNTALERLSYILVMLVVAAFFLHVLRPVGGLFHEIIAYHRDGWLDRLKHVWSAMGIGLPVMLAVIALAGFYYTALHITWRLQSTLWLLVFVCLLQAFLFRWVVVNRRKLSIQQARERRAAAQESAAAAAAEGEPAGESILNLTPEPEVDLATTSTQSRRLMQLGLTALCLMGLWLIWADVFPALRIFDRWQLATTFVESPEGADVVDGKRGDWKPVTITHLFVAVLIGVFTLLAAHNLPGLLEMSLLSRLPLDASVRYAITTLASYVILIVGIIAGFNMIGVGWSKVQWLAAALTVGLGFGLQEVFANFICGVIILFERPVRVGDVVTVADVSGVVSRIRMRATTITNWDRKEFIVPNKEFITGRLMNWTLSDTITRVTVNVGIAYGSDTRRAAEILRQTALENPYVLKDPEPIITFEEFGDSSLNFAVRLFLPSLQNRLTCVHEFHTAVDLAFREAGIEIAFPQRDIHIRTAKAWLPGNPLDNLDHDGQPLTVQPVKKLDGNGQN